MARTVREVVIALKAEGQGQVSQALQQTSRGAEKGARSLKQMGDAGKKGTEGLKSFGSQLLLLPGAITATIAIAQRLIGTFKTFTVDLIQQGGVLADIQGGFDKLAESGVDAAGALDALKTATEGTIRDSELQLSVLKALGGQFKISTKDLGELTRAIFLISKPTGEFNQNFKAAISALEKGTPSALASVKGFDDLAIAIDLAARNAAAAGEVFTLQDRQTLGLSLALERAAEITARFSGQTDSAGDKLDKAKASLGNFTDAIKKATASSPELIAAVAGLGETLGATGDSGEEFGKVIGELLAELVELAGEVLKAFKDNLPAIKDFVELLGDVLDVVSSMTEEIGILGTAIVLAFSGAAFKKAITFALGRLAAVATAAVATQTAIGGATVAGGVAAGGAVAGAAAKGVAARAAVTGAAGAAAKTGVIARFGVPGLIIAGVIASGKLAFLGAEKIEEIRAEEAKRERAFQKAARAALPEAEKRFRERAIELGIETTVRVIFDPETASLRIAEDTSRELRKVLNPELEKISLNIKRAAVAAELDTMSAG